MSKYHRRVVGRPQRTSREELLTAASEIGFADLSIAALAKVSEVPRSTIYGYFHTDADLIQALVTLSWAGLAWPSARDFSSWRVYLEAVVWTIWDHVVEREGLAEAMSATGRDTSPLIPAPPEMVQALLDFDLSPTNALLALDVLADMTSQAFFGDRAADKVGSGSTMRVRAVELSDAERALPPEAQPAYRQLIDGDPRHWYAAKLAVVMNGLAQAFAD